MALHINLYHEIQKQKALQRRDPLKFAIAGLIFVAACFAGYYLLQLNSLRIVSNQLKDLENQLTTLRPKAEAAQKRAAEVSETLKASTVLVNRIEKRFYWAPVLSDLMQIVPPEVQLTKFSGDVSNDENKRFSFTIDGIAAGESPRKTADDLRLSLREHFSKKNRSVSSEYRSLDEAPGMATLNGKKVPTVTFGIHVTMLTGEEPAPTK